QIDFSRLQMPINIEHLRHHWNKFFNRHVNPVIKNALNKKINNYEKRPVSSNIHY
ncbi:HNH endonuclease, partial [Salmonella enterica]|nr:HNH endonuclease [Salmonella enterica]